MAFLSALEALVFSKAGYGVWGLMVGLGVIGGVLSFWMMRWILAKPDNLLVPPWVHKVFPRFAFFSSLFVVIYVPLISLTMLPEVSVEEMPPMVFGGLGWLLAVLDSDRKVRGTNESA